MIDPTLLPAMSWTAEAISPRGTSGGGENHWKTGMRPIWPEPQEQLHRTGPAQQNVDAIEYNRDDQDVDDLERKACNVVLFTKHRSVLD